MKESLDMTHYLSKPIQVAEVNRAGPDVQLQR
jgi:hypothetical protein